MNNGRKRRTIRNGAVAAASIGLVAAPLALMSGTAFALTPITATTTATATTTPGATSTSTGSVTINYGGTATGITAGDHITVDLAPGGSAANPNSGVSFVNPPTVTGATFAGFSTASGTTTPQDQINLTVPTTATAAGTITVTDTVTAGTTAVGNYYPVVTDFTAAAIATNPAAPAALPVTSTDATTAFATVDNTVPHSVGVSDGTAVAIPTSGSLNNVSLPNITITPSGTPSATVPTGQLLPAAQGTPVVVTLTNATFASTPTVTSSDGTTPTAVSATGSTFTFTPALTASATAVYTIGNIHVNVITPVTPAPTTPGVNNPGAAGIKVEATVTQAGNTFPATLGGSFAPASGTTPGNTVVLGVTTTFDATTFAGIDEDTTAADVYNQEIARGAISTSSLVLATDANFPDALSAAYLAKAHNAGILLSPPGFLSTPTKDEILTYHPSTIYVLGGTVAISAAVITQINALYPSTSPPTIVRLGGADQFATNQLVNTSVGTTGTPLDLTTAFAGGGTAFNTSGGNGSTSGTVTGPAKTAIVASGTSFPDALAASALANKDGIPIILTLGTTLSPTAQAQLTSLGVQQVIVVGGPVAVSNTVVSAINGSTASGGMGIPVLRVAGIDATDTARQFALFEQSVAGFQSGGPTFVARGDYYTDALVSAPYLANMNQPLLLTENPSTVGPYLTQYLNAQARATGTQTASVSPNAFTTIQFGGPVAITPATDLAIENALAAGAQP